MTTQEYSKERDYGFKLDQEHLDFLAEFSKIEQFRLVKNYDVSTIVKILEQFFERVEEALLKLQQGNSHSPAYPFTLAQLSGAIRAAFFIESPQLVEKGLELVIQIMNCESQRIFLPSRIVGIIKQVYKVKRRKRIKS